MYSVECFPMERSCTTSLTTPTTVSQSLSVGLSAIEMRLPITPAAPASGQILRATLSLRITAPGARASSVAAKSRPSTSRTPIAAKYPGDTSILSTL